MMRKGILAFSVFSALLLALFVSRVSGQTPAAPSLVVICGNCEGGLFGKTNERGMLLMKGGRESGGELWFYSFTTDTEPKLVGNLPSVGASIQWNRRASRE